MFTIAFQDEDLGSSLHDLLRTARGRVTVAAEIMALVGMAPFLLLEVGTISAYGFGWLGACGGVRTACCRMPTCWANGTQRDCGLPGGQLDSGLRSAGRISAKARSRNVLLLLSCPSPADLWNSLDMLTYCTQVRQAADRTLDLLASTRTPGITSAGSRAGSNGCTCLPDLASQSACSRCR